MKGEDLYNLIAEEASKVHRVWNREEERYEWTCGAFSQWSFIDRKAQRAYDNVAKRLGDRRVRKTYKNV